MCKFLTHSLAHKITKTPTFIYIPHDTRVTEEEKVEYNEDVVLTEMYIKSLDFFVFITVKNIPRS